MTNSEDKVLHALLDERRSWEAITALFDRLANVDDITEMSRIVVQATRQLVGAQGATFVIREEDQCYYLDEDAVGPLWRGMKFPLTACIAGWCMLSGRSVGVPDISADDRIPHDVYETTFVKSLIMAPVSEHEPIAAMGVYWSEIKEHTAQTVQIVEAIARCAGSVLQRQFAQQREFEQRERMFVAFEEAGLGYWQVSVDDLALTSSLAFRAKFDEAENPTFSYAAFLDRLHADDSAHLQVELERLTRTGGQLEFSARIVGDGGHEKKLQLRGYSEPSLDLPAVRIVGFSK